MASSTDPKEACGGAEAVIRRPPSLTADFLSISCSTLPTGYDSSGVNRAPLRMIFNDFPENMGGRMERVFAGEERLAGVARAAFGSGRRLAGGTRLRGGT